MYYLWPTCKHDWVLYKKTLPLISLSDEQSSSRHLYEQLAKQAKLEMAQMARHIRGVRPNRAAIGGRNFGL